MKKILFTFVFVLALFFICLYFIFSGMLVLPQSFSIGFLNVRYYGLFLGLAMAAGYFLAFKRAKIFSINLTAAQNVLFWVVIGGFIGARLYHILSSAAYYSNHPFDIFKVWNGGLSIYGVILGGLITLWLYVKIINHQSSIINYLNWLTPSLLLGQIIGRFGNLFNYELYGYPTSLPWKMFVPALFRPEAYVSFSFFHPLFLYEQLGNGIILFYLFYREKQGRGGTLFYWYLLLYNVLRVGLEYLRIDSVFIGDFRQNALVSLLIILAAFIAIYKNKHEYKAP